jgi:hypothetical protein
MFVMMIMRALPDAVRTQCEDSENAHENLCEPGLWQNGMMLLVMVNDKKSQQQEPRENAANNFGRQIKIPKSSRNRGQPQKRSGKNAEPARQLIIHGIRSGG